MDSWLMSGLIGAAAGAVSVLIVYLIFPKRLRQSSAFKAVLVVAVVIGIQLSNRFLLPEVDAYQIEQRLTDNPVLQAIRDTDPDMFNQISSAFESARKSGKSQVEQQNAIRQLISQTLQIKISKASDDAVYKFAGMIVEQMSLLLEANPVWCVNYLMPDPNVGIGFSPADVFPMEVLLREIEINTLVIRTHNPSTILPSEEEAQILFDPIVDKLIERYTDEQFALTDTRETALADPVTTCQITIDMHAAAMELDRDDAVKVLRWLFAP